MNEFKENKDVFKLKRLIRNDFGLGTKWDMPVIKKNIVKDSNLKFISFNNIKINGFDRYNVDKIVHFFIEDTEFEKVYHEPEKYMLALAKYKYVFSPDFSLYINMPLPIQIYNVFRNRWCGAYWQSNGLKVIPTISWSTEESYDFCFAGVEKSSEVAISTLGSKKAKRRFLNGYNEMLRVIEPSVVYCFDKPFKEMKGNIIYIDYLATTGRLK